MRAFASMVMAGVIVLGAHCGSGQDTSIFSTDACNNPYAGQCGKPCTLDGECGSGLHCEQNGCTAACTPGQKCDNGFMCTANGRCAQDDVVFQNPDASVGPCADVTLKLAKVIPTVQLLIDQSGSMTAKLDGNKDRWQVVNDVLMNPTDGIVKTLNNDVIFGFNSFQALDETVGGVKQTKTCPALIQVPPAPNNYSAINAAYPANLPADSNNTPTAESFRAVAGLDETGAKLPTGFAASKTDGPKIIILATDGNPDTCGPNVPDPAHPGQYISGPDSNGNEAPKQKTYKAIQDGFAASISTFIIAVSNEVTPDVKKRYANAGAGQPLDTGTAKYFDANNKADLVTAFNQIIFPFRDCKFQLNGTVQTGKESLGKVLLNGAPLGYNDPNGWKLNNPKEIEVTGTACTAIQGGSANLTVSFPCDAVTNIN